jgi:uncharacterized sulfatase
MRTPVASALLLVSLSCAPSTDPPVRHNVLFIVADDLNVALGSYGAYPTARTPNLDRLAAEGVRFDRAYAQHPVCNPSRASFLSGLRPETTQVLHNFLPLRHAVGEADMLPEYFRNHGYLTARVGKVAHGRYEDSVAWDISENALQRDPDDYLPGVDHSEVRDNSWTEGSDDGMSRADVFAPHGRTGGLPLTWRATDEREEDTPDGRTTRRVIEILREQDGAEPFFIAAGFHKPHQPWVAPASFFEQHPLSETALPDEPADDRNDIPVPAIVGYADDALHTDDQQRQAIAAYHATVTLIDHQVGLLLDALSELGLEESTIVVFVSDHGFHLGEHGGMWRKQSQFEESTRVPLIVRAPGFTGGATTTGLVELVDLYPTLADLSGLPLPTGLEGTSFRPLLEDPDRDWKSAIFSRSDRFSRPDRLHVTAGLSVRTARYRYTEWTPAEGGDVEVELYDLETDPREFENLSKDPAHAALRDDLAQALEAGWKSAVP